MLEDHSLSVPLGVISWHETLGGEGVFIYTFLDFCC